MSDAVRGDGVGPAIIEQRALQVQEDMRLLLLDAQNHWKEYRNSTVEALSKANVAAAEFSLFCACRLTERAHTLGKRGHGK